MYIIDNSMPYEFPRRPHALKLQSGHCKKGHQKILLFTVLIVKPLSKSPNAAHDTITMRRKHIKSIIGSPLIQKLNWIISVAPQLL
jgi:hypothetical protein